MLDGFLSAVFRVFLIDIVNGDSIGGYNLSRVVNFLFQTFNIVVIPVYCFYCFGVFFLEHILLSCGTLQFFGQCLGRRLKLFPMLDQFLQL